MIKNEFTILLDEIIKEEIDILEEIIKEEIEPLADFGSPEKVLGKKYEEWNREDFKKARAIFRNDEDATNWLVKKQVDRVKAKEESVNLMEEV